MDGIVVIAASAGGLGPLRSIIAALPVPCTAVVFVVMHIGSNQSILGHPDPESMARILKFSQTGPKILYSNYRQPYTTPWSQQALRDAYDYDCCFPLATPGHMIIEL